MFYKNAFKILGVFVYFIVCALIFNHVFALLGVVLAIFGLIFIGNIIYNKLKETKL